MLGKFMNCNLGMSVSSVSLSIRYRDGKDNSGNPTVINSKSSPTCTTTSYGMSYDRIGVGYVIILKVPYIPLLAWAC